MKKVYLMMAAGAMTLGLGVINEASAVFITVNDNLADNQIISAGETLNGSFDINPGLAGDQYVLPYDINSGTASFSFLDDSDPNTYAGTQTGGYSLTSSYWAGGQKRYYVRTQYDYFYDAADGATVSLTGLDVSEDGGTSWFSASPTYDGSTTTSNTTTSTYSYGCGWHSTCYGTYYHTSYYTTQNYDVSQGYSGGFTIDMDLTPAGLEDLSFDGILDFSVTGTTGDLIFQNGILTVDVNENPAAVPEPATMLLFGVGLAGLVGYRRKSKK